jgi:ribosomal protein S18 acetylase RimI-like enzyme
MGVAQPARGTGVANALLARAVARCASKSASYLTLAVDARNTPANCFYRRWGFLETRRMNAWIATPSGD